jgi:uncharacterized protein (UPF0276 family)
MPFPFRSELIAWGSTRIQSVVEMIGCPIGVENIATYLQFIKNDMPEWDFLREIANQANCGILLDINNLYISTINHGLDADTYLSQIPWDRVLYAHIAGHQKRSDGLLHDTHDRAVGPEVWQLYRKAWQLGGPFPTIVEWDVELPKIEVLINQVQQARAVRT